jgi:predicted DNA-binding transcriptional regulator AlpA
MLAPAVLNYAAAAAYLGLPSANALRQMVCRGQAPPSIKFGKRARRFRVVDIDEWLAAKAEANQEQKPPPPPRRRGRPTKAEAMARRWA